MSETLKESEQRHISRLPELTVLLLSLAIALGIAYLSYRNAKEMAEARRQMEVSQEIDKLSVDLLSALKDLETGQRGYLVTGEEQFLDPYRSATAEVPELLKKLEAQTEHRPDQRSRLRGLEPLIAAKLTELQETVRLSRSRRLDEALSIVRQGRGKALMDQIRQGLNAIAQTAKTRSGQYAAAADESADRLRVVGTAGSLVLFGFLAALAIAMSRSTRLREELVRRTRASEKLWETTFCSIADAVIVTDGKARITFINSVAQNLSGWTAADAVGTPITEVLKLVNEDSRAPVLNPILDALKTGNAVGLVNHTILISRYGRETSIDDSAAPIRDEAGKVVGAVLVFRDISAKRRTEKELAETAAALGHANEELQEFAYTAAHDLRSPLNSVNNMAQLLEKRYAEPLGPEGRELIAYITGAAQRMGRLIEDILAFANATETKREAAGPVALDAILSRTLVNLADEIRNSGTKVESGPLPAVLAHETPMLQLLQNLIGNAIKYRNPEEEPRISISAVVQDGFCVLRVNDNGIGIDAKYAEEVFKPFKRLHGQTYSGSGIGLAICQKIAAAYGGRIWVESEAGKGATFVVTLPLAEQARAAAGGAFS